MRRGISRGMTTMSARGQEGKILEGTLAAGEEEETSRGGETGEAAGTGEEKDGCGKDDHN